MEIYYVTSSKLDNNVKEGFRFKEGSTNTSYKFLIPSITEVISLNKPIKNKLLTVKIYIFSCDTFFREYLTSEFILFNNLERIKNMKL